MIIADSGFWVAIFDNNDNHHLQTIKVAETLQEPLITTLPVITEVCYLLQKRRHQNLAIGFLRSYRRGAFHLFEMNATHLERSKNRVS